MCWTRTTIFITTRMLFHCRTEVRPWGFILLTNSWGFQVYLHPMSKYFYKVRWCFCYVSHFKLLGYFLTSVGNTELYWAPLLSTRLQIHRIKYMYCNRVKIFSPKCRSCCTCTRLSSHCCVHNSTQCSIAEEFSRGSRLKYRVADKSLARPTSLSIVFSVQGTGGSQTGPDPENRVGDQDTGSPGRPVSSRLQVPGETFPSWSG
jgi:hypothetical protein